MTFDTDDPPEGKIKGASELSEDAADGITINEVAPAGERVQELRDKVAAGTITETEYAEYTYLDLLLYSLDEVPDDPTIEGVAEDAGEDPRVFYDEFETMQERGDETPN